MILYLIAIIIFLSVLLLIEAVYLSWKNLRDPEAQKVNKRLRILSAGGIRPGGQLNILRKRDLSKVSSINTLLMKLPRIRKLDRLIVQSGSKLNAARFLLITIVSATAGALDCWWFSQKQIILSVVGMLAFGILPLLYLVYKKKKRLQRFEAQLPEALDLIVRALRSGHAFNRTLQMIAEEMPDPIGSEFSTTFDEINYGLSVKEALENLSSRLDSTDLKYFTIAVLIQRESGGNLAEILEKTSYVIRERFKLFGKIRVLAAQGKLSGWILCLLPVALGAILSILFPEFTTPLFNDPIGPYLIYCGMILMAFGVLSMWKIIKIEV
jgi:tight adherence protein B